MPHESARFEHDVDLPGQVKTASASLDLSRTIRVAIEWTGLCITASGAVVA